MYRECVWMSTNAALNWSFCIVLYRTVFNILYCTIQYCTVLYCAVLYCTVLYCTVLYCIRLWCIDMYSPFCHRYFFYVHCISGCHGDCTVDWLSW